MGREIEKERAGHPEETRTKLKFNKTDITVVAVVQCDWEWS